MSHFEHCESSIAHSVQMLKQLYNGSLEKEVVSLDLRLASLFTAELNVLDDARCWLENRLAAADFQDLNTAESQALHELN